MPSIDVYYDLRAIVRRLDTEFQLHCLDMASSKEVLEAMEEDAKVQKERNLLKDRHARLKEAYRMLQDAQ